MYRFIIFLLLAPAAYCDISDDVREALSQGKVALADSKIQSYRKQHGVTPEMLEALSWMGRGSLALKQFDKAEAYAQETEKLVHEALKGRTVDSDPRLAIALGAAIEVQAQVLAARGERSDAVALLRKELLAWNRTSIRTRIQKNINLLSLEGKPAPPLDEREFLGAKPAPLATLRGRPVLLFFWAHWCGDCKAESPILAKLQHDYAARGLTVIAPTQRYGYAAGGEDASAADELKYIEEVRRRFYPDLLSDPAPISEENFKLYGASTTPTIVLIDRQGIVRLYHPGAMTEQELKSAIDSVV
jgi:thiol-disulfide isomerase/thioredoxin